MRFTIDDVWNIARATVSYSLFVLPVVLAIYGNPREVNVRLAVAGCVLFCFVWVPFNGGPPIISRLAIAPHVGLRQALRRQKPLMWSDQVVLVTGSSGALGSKLYAELTRRGATVVGVDVVAAAAPPEGDDRQHFFQADISSPMAVRALPATIKAAVGRPVTVLINNAGVVHGRPILDLTDGEIDRSIGVNYLAHFHLLRAFLPDMITRRQGAIVTVSSALGLIGASSLTDYCSTKAALVGLHDSLSRELLHQCVWAYKTPLIKTHLVLPAFIGDSPLFARANLPKSRFFRFGAPKLQPDALANAIVAQVERGQSGSLSLPLFVNYVPFVRLLPPLLREIAQALAGADYAMDSFAAARSAPIPPSSPALAVEVDDAVRQKCPGKS